MPAHASIPAPKPVDAQPSSRLAVLRRMRERKLRDDEEIDIDLSPLIDCVFLLLIFFLVTTMFKKLERQIPMETPDFTSAVANAAHTESVIYALDREGTYYRAREGKRSLSGLDYVPLDSFEDDLRRLAKTRGVQTDIRLDADREVPVQVVVDTLDTLALRGFENVGMRLLHEEKEYFELKGGR